MNQPQDPTDILGPLRDQPPPQLPQTANHPRDEVMQAAGDELLKFFTDWQGRYELTAYEYLYLFTVLERGMLQALCIAERESPK